MTGMGARYLRIATAVVVALGVTGVMHAAWAGAKKSAKATSVAEAKAPNSVYNIGSLASEFLQSQTQMRILSDDDRAAPACSDKHFVKADVINQPSVKVVGSKGVTERKWLEQWTLDRCGTPLAYYVFFTEIGNGGAYVSVVDPK
ncbi:MAG TPA: hypothetical protein VKY65_12905 [Alphaproteobacteria bacterium]|nr:hypothetical protein [Alphaproteobacteria bacterium]